MLCRVTSPNVILSPFCILTAFLLRTFAYIPPEEDNSDEKDDYDDIFDAVGLEEVYITVKITHHHTSL
jgi:hypothetical protein